VAIALLLVPDKTPTITAVGLLALFAVCVYPTVKLAWVLKQPKLRIPISLILLAITVSMYGRMVWPLKKYLDFTEDQQKRFVEVMQGTTPAKRIVLRCAASENVCAAAGQFIQLFQKAGWKVQDNAIGRSFLGNPQFGVILLVHGSGTIPDPSNPNYGLWAPIIDHERDCLIRAFKAINVTVDKTMVDPSLEESSIVVVFGPTPSD
jgi:hypothetical protein